MEKRVLLAALICAVFLSWYSKTLFKPLSKNKLVLKPSPSQEAVQEQEKTVRLLQPILESEDTVYLESPGLSLELGKTSGAIRHVTLKQFLDTTGKAPIRFGQEVPVVGLQIGQENLAFQLVSASSEQAELEAKDSNGNNYHLSYSVDTSNTLINIELRKKQSSAIKSDVDPEFHLL